MSKELLKRGRKSRDGISSATKRLDLDILSPFELQALKERGALKKEYDIPGSLLEDMEEEFTLDPSLAESRLKLVLSNGKSLGNKKTLISSKRQKTKHSHKTKLLEHSSCFVDGIDMDSEEDLQIDETPRKEKKVPSPRKRLPKFPRKLPRAKPCSDPNRIREPGELEFDVEEDYTTDEELDDMMTQKLATSSGAGGILDLLKASRQVGGPDYSALGEAPASPSTQEAIQGMLCMANLQSSSSSTAASSLQAWWAAGQERSGGSVSLGTPVKIKPGSRKVIERPGKRPVKRPVHHSMDSDEEEGSMDEHETLGTCFRDAEYVYPSLESDEDDATFRSRPKKKKATDDAPWNPKARVTPTLPRQERPVREGTRVASVETGLAAAAAKLSQQELQRSERRKLAQKKSMEAEKLLDVEEEIGTALEEEEDDEEEEEQPTPLPPVVPESPQDVFSGSLADHEYTAGPNIFGMAQVNRGTTPMAPGVFLTHRRPSSTLQNTQSAFGKRPKKGLATAKQRLGKILKIHRNGKLLM